MKMVQSFFLLLLLVAVPESMNCLIIEGTTIRPGFKRIEGNAITCKLMCKSYLSCPINSYSQFTEVGPLGPPMQYVTLVRILLLPGTSRGHAVIRGHPFMEEIVLGKSPRQRLVLKVYRSDLLKVFMTWLTCLMLAGSYASIDNNNYEQVFFRSHNLECFWKVYFTHL